MRRTQQDDHVAAIESGRRKILSGVAAGRVIKEIREKTGMMEREIFNMVEDVIAARRGVERRGADNRSEKNRWWFMRSHSEDQGGRPPVYREDEVA